jgi:predicted metalloprotease with PDZ domain
MRWWSGVLVAVAAVPGVLAAQTEPVRYRVAVSPGEDLIHVRAEFVVPAGRDTFVVSLPAWTPGNYTVQNYARYVHGFTAQTPEGRSLPWDRLDKDSWRITLGGARSVVVEFATNADTLDLSMALVEKDVAFFNGTNLFLYPEGSDWRFQAEVTLQLPAGWRVATGLAPAGPDRFRAADYHDLVDAPFLVGAIAVDSVVVDGKPVRLAIYPDSALTPAVRDTVMDAIRRIAETQNRIFGGSPYDDYTVLMLAPFVDLPWAGGLEHHNSQFDIMAASEFAPGRRTGRLGEFTRPLLSHEFFHLWNVKRIRPAELWPYDYAREQFTPLLWWSEGVTDYYGDVTLARAGLWSVDRFVGSVNHNIQEVEGAGEIVAAEDASIDTWIEPTFVEESQYYYPKGSLLGLMLDIRIREATDNQHSLDDVMRALYQNHWQRGRGFSTQDLLGYIRPWFPGVDDFYARYVNGREPLPYEVILPRGGIAASRRETKTPFFGIAPGEAREGGVEVLGVVAGSLAASVGLQEGDILLRVGDVPTTNPQAFGAAIRSRFQNAEGQPVDVVYRRSGRQLTQRGVMRMRVTRSYVIGREANPSPQARAILEGILAGR